MNYPYNCKHLRFPLDEGRHGDANTEWWYFNAHVKANDDSLYALMTAYAVNNEKYMIIIDIDNKRFYPFYTKEHILKYSNQKLDLLYGPDWWKTIDNKAFSYKMYIQNSDVILNLDVESTKPPVVLGEKKGVPMGKGGYTQWYALTRLNVSGELVFEGEKKHLSGSGWIDRQWGNWNWYGYGEWKWFGIQLENNAELIFSKTFEPISKRSLFSLSCLVLSDGSVKDLGHFEIIDKESWVSPNSGFKYPVKWDLVAPYSKIKLEVIPQLENQETPTNFWEGSCKVSGSIRGEEVSGWCFAEMHPEGIYRPEGILPGSSIKRLIFYLEAILRSRLFM